MTTMTATTTLTVPRRYPAWLAPVLAFLLLAAPLMGISGYFAQQQAAGEQARIAFSAANNLYTTGQYQLAQQAYRQMKAQGVDSVELLYNLALTQIQLSDGVGAVESLRAAQELAPRDTRIDALLSEATALASGQGATIPPSEPPLLPLQQSELALLALILWTITGAFVATAILSRSTAFRIILFVLALLTTLAALAMLLLA